MILGRCTPMCRARRLLVGLGEQQAHELTKFGYPPVRRVVVDTYMAQHPGDGRDRRDRQLVFVHLLGLYSVLEQQVPPLRVTRLLGPAVPVVGAGSWRARRRCRPVSEGRH